MKISRASCGIFLSDKRASFNVTSRQLFLMRLEKTPRQPSAPGKAAGLPLILEHARDRSRTGRANSSFRPSRCTRRHYRANGSPSARTKRPLPQLIDEKSGKPIDPTTRGAATRSTRASIGATPHSAAAPRPGSPPPETARAGIRRGRCVQTTLRAGRVALMARYAREATAIPTKSRTSAFVPIKNGGTFKASHLFSGYKFAILVERPIMRCCKHCDLRRRAPVNSKWVRTCSSQMPWNGQ
jgi:hypothetical protein